MSRQLQAEHDENVAWTRTLEERVEQKTRELKRAHEHVLHTEKMASIGKMAAVLAHEINNPAVRHPHLCQAAAEMDRPRRMPRDDAVALAVRKSATPLTSSPRESRRCGDLVKNLLTFSRTTPINLQPTNLNQVVDRSLRLVQHQLDLAGIQVQLAA